MITGDLRVLSKFPDTIMRKVRIYNSVAVVTTNPESQRLLQQDLRYNQHYGFGHPANHLIGSLFH